MGEGQDPSLDIENVNAYARQMQERAFAAEALVERLRLEVDLSVDLRERIEEENERLREALRPFARLDYDIGDEWRDVCEAARAALGAERADDHAS